MSATTTISIKHFRTVAGSVSTFSFDPVPAIDNSFELEATHEQIESELDELVGKFEDALAELSDDAYERYENVLDACKRMIACCRDHEGRLDSAAKDWAYDRWIE